VTGAAAGLLAVLVWWSWLEPIQPSAQAPLPELNGPVLVPAPAVVQSRAPSPADQRTALMAEADVVRVAWTPGREPAAAEASGDVVWSDAWQKGFMRFHGLAWNDPKELQYQLWIFDPTRDARYPVDGGVFDVSAAQADPASGDVLVPIAPKLRVRSPTLFLVTVEKPGGVVVSIRARIALTAVPRR
jgi:hypothetical protein